MIFIDDGSTGTRIAIIGEDRSIDVQCVSNRAEYGRGVADDESCTYLIEGQHITFFEAADSIRTANLQYQYSDHCISAVHHALHQCGFSGQEVDISVTLPISEFYRDGRIDTDNIARKKAAYQKAVIPEIGQPITIKNVSIYPEGIPAVQPCLVKDGKSIVDDDEITFLADMGGSTLDLALFSGAAKRIIKAKSIKIGMFDTFDLIKSHLNLPKARDMQLMKLLETGSAAGGRFTIDRAEVTKPVMVKAANAIIDFLGEDINTLSHSFLIGGGAQLLKDVLCENYHYQCEIVSNPTHALIRAIAHIEQYKQKR
ncbi:plasmid segregation protein ParM domain-containing protein [Photobacterium damselae]|uniref:plasmid segregation protein ParM domain-containing protein n=3 Tax=Photobacterium damselae TaxID=38293 RepID=UPI0040686B99